jgi:hypothetical protein
MEAFMFKEAIICGIGMVIDLSGSHLSQSQSPNSMANDGIASDWKQVGSVLQFSIAAEQPQIEAVAAKQLQLKLG